MSWIGDLVLLFQREKIDLPTRNATMPWQVLAEHAHWQLLIQPSTTEWKGFPLLSGKGEGWHYWLCGECYGVSPGNEHRFLLDVLTGQQPYEALNGHCFLCAWHESTQYWHLWTNRFATFHVYLGYDGKRTTVGTYAKAVSATASSKRLDWLGLTSFFICGFFLQDRTQYEDVRILRPATHLVLDENGQCCQEERTWNWTYQPDRGRSYNDTIAEFNYHFQTVMNEQLSDGRVAIPISGGLDSRSTVAAINEESRGRVWAYSYGYTTNSIETKIARQIAQARQLPFESFTIAPYLFNQLPQIMEAVEGFQDVTQCRQASILTQLQEHADYVIAAHWGDVWFDDMGLLAEATLSTEAFITYAWKKMAKKGGQWLLTHLCGPQLATASPEKLVRELMAEELSQVAHLSEPDFRMKAFKTWQWSARWTTGSIRMYQPAAFPRLPFYDTRLADFFATVPSAYVAGRQMQIDYLKQNAPDLARIPWQVYQANLYQYRHFNTWLLPLRAVRKGWRILTGRKVIERNWEVQFLNPGGEQKLAHWLLQPGLRLHEYLPVSMVQDLLTQFHAEPVAYGYAVAMLLTFSAWLELNK